MKDRKAEHDDGLPMIALTPLELYIIKRLQVDYMTGPSLCNPGHSEQEPPVLRTGSQFADIMYRDFQGLDAQGLQPFQEKSKVEEDKRQAGLARMRANILKK
jgi:hypothetical protein